MKRPFRSPRTIGQAAMLMPSEQLIEEVRRERGPSTILSFSMGKDSIAAYLAIKPHFAEIVPYYLYPVPGLVFVEESLEYFRRKIGRIIALPHPSFVRWLNNLTYQSPGNAAVIRAAALPEFEYLDIFNWVCDIAKLDRKKVLVASGVRAADSPLRRIAFTKHGAISVRQKQYYPVWDWDKARVLAAIEASDLRLPLDYHLFGRSFDGLDYRFLAPIKRERPEDWKTILEWFPLAEAEVWRHERGA